MWRGRYREEGRKERGRRDFILMDGSLFVSVCLGFLMMMIKDFLYSNTYMRLCILFSFIIRTTHKGIKG
jgi:hypothetical protein